MAQFQTKRIHAYLRKMAIDGYIIYMYTRVIMEMNTLCPPLAGTSTKSPRELKPKLLPIRPTGGFAEISFGNAENLRS